MRIKIQWIIIYTKKKKYLSVRYFYQKYILFYTWMIVTQAIVTLRHSTVYTLCGLNVELERIFPFEYLTKDATVNAEHFLLKKKKKWG